MAGYGQLPDSEEGEDNHLKALIGCNLVLLITIFVSAVGTLVIFVLIGMQQSN